MRFFKILMSSRQIKYLREQLEKGKKKKEENLDDVDPVDLDTTEHDFSLLATEDTGEAPPPPEVEVKAPLPVKPKQKKKKEEEFDQDMEYAALLSMQKEKEAATQEEQGFSMQNLNIIRELKSVVGKTRFNEVTKVPKSASSIRFMGKLSKWPAQIPMYFNFTKEGEDYKVNYTEYGEQQSQIFKALARINDADGIMELGRTAHFSPSVLPLLCQSLLFQREFDAATEIALRGFYILQQSLPQNFIPMKSKLLSSPGRREFLELIAFLARFSFRRSCYKTSSALWQFGIGLTEDDPCDFLLMAAIPALYAEDRKFIDEMIETKSWKDVPLKYIPDWPLCQAILKLPDEIESLARTIAIFPFVFEDLGSTSEMVPTDLLSSLGGVFRKRVAKYMEKPELDSMFETAVIVAEDMDESDEQAVMLSFWFSVSAEVNIGDMVEEMVLPTG